MGTFYGLSSLLGVNPELRARCTIECGLNIIERKQKREVSEYKYKQEETREPVHKIRHCSALSPARNDPRAQTQE